MPMEQLFRAASIKVSTDHSDRVQLEMPRYSKESSYAKAAEFRWCAAVFFLSLPSPVLRIIMSALSFEAELIWPGRQPPWYRCVHTPFQGSVPRPVQTRQAFGSRCHLHRVRAFVAAILACRSVCIPPRLVPSFERRKVSL